MSIAFARVEERLIHGQVVVMWSQVINYDAFVVIDDAEATNPLLRNLLNMACPKGTKLYVFTTKEAIEKINTLPEKLFLIAKSPTTFRELYQNGVKFDSLNIGSVHFKNGKKEIYRTVCLSDEEIQALKDLINSGVDCSIQKLPTENKVDVKSLI